MSLPFHKRAKPNPTAYCVLRQTDPSKVGTTEHALMASSPSRPKTHDKGCHNSPSEAGGEGKDGDWLQLGLGLSVAWRKQQHRQQEDQEHFPPNPVSASASVSSSSSSHHFFQTDCHQTGLELGLGLGLDLGLEREAGVRVLDVAPPSNHYYRSSSWQNQDHEDRYYYDYDLDHCHKMASWPCHMNPDGNFLGLHDWQMPVPNDPHDYSSQRRRPHSGLWFTLQSYTNREGEALPQIPKAYIRVKDENVTVFMVKKYLVTKLGLSNEAEIDISCMGQNLLHTQTLKQVMDSVWLPRLVESLNSTTLSFQNSLPVGSSVNHLMSLQYGRPCVSN